MIKSLTEEEKDWITDLRAGKEIALRKIFDSYYKYLLVTAYNIVNDQSKAKDLAQDVFYELWKKREKIQINTSLKAYLRRSVINRSINFLKSQKRFQFGDDALSAEWESKESDAQQELEGSDLQNIINQAIDSLPEKCKLIFKLSRLEKFSHKEIAEKLGISTKTIENQMTKALKTLRTAIAKYKELGIIIFLIQLFF